MAISTTQYFDRDYTVTSMYLYETLPSMNYSVNPIPITVKWKSVINIHRLYFERIQAIQNDDGTFKYIYIYKLPDKYTVFLWEGSTVSYTTRGNSELHMSRIVTGCCCYGAHT